MCGRFPLAVPAEEIENVYNVKVYEGFRPNFNTAPGQNGEEIKIWKNLITCKRIDWFEFMEDGRIVRTESPVKKILQE